MINIKLGQLKRSLGKIDKVADKLKKDKKVLFLKWSIFGFKDIQQHFKDQSGSKGKWKPLSPITIERRRKGKGKGSAQILQDTGSLRNSLRPGIGLKDFQRDRIILFTSIKYAKKHDEGLRGMPKREFMWLSKDAKDQIKKQTIKFIRPWR